MSVGAFGEGISTWMGRLTKGPPQCRFTLVQVAPPARRAGAPSVQVPSDPLGA